MVQPPAHAVEGEFYSSARSTPRAHEILAVLVAMVLAVGLSFLCEWRMRWVISGGLPGPIASWSALRLGIVALLFLFPLAPFCVWISRGGISRLGSRLRHDHWRFVRRGVSALALCCAAALLGWFLGLLVASFLGVFQDWRFSWGGMALAASLALLIFFRSEVRADAAWGILLVGIPVGLIFVCLNSVQPNAVWDGQGHFDAANAMSYLEDAQYDGGDLLAIADIPYRPIIEEIEGDELGVIWSEPSISAAQETVEAIDELQKTGETQQAQGTARVHGTSWLGANAVGRAPLALGLWLGRLLGFTNVGEYSTARICNMLIYLFVWFFGVRYLLGSRLVFSLMALAPVALFMGSGFSYDPWMLALIGFSFCRFVGEIQRDDEPLGLAGAFLILVPFFLGCLVKAVYAPLVLAFLGLPASKFSQPRRRAWWVIGVLCCMGMLLATFAVPFLSRSGEGYTDARMEQNVDSKSQFGLVLENPANYLIALGSSGLEFFGPVFFLNSVAKFHYLPPTDFGMVLGVPYLVLITFVALFVRDGSAPTRFGPLIKLESIVGCLGAYVLLATSLYIGFTSLGAITVSGLQSRYLLPLFPAIYGIVLAFPFLAKRLSHGFSRWCQSFCWYFVWGYYLLFFVMRYYVFFV